MIEVRNPRRIVWALAAGLLACWPAAAWCQTRTGPGLSSGSGSGTGTGAEAGTGLGTTGTGTEAGTGLGTTGTGMEGLRTPRGGVMLPLPGGAGQPGGARYSGGIMSPIDSTSFFGGELSP